MIRFLLTLTITLCLYPSFASIKRTCKVQYQRQDGTWSEEYTMTVEFMTGSELNTRTHQYKYDSYKKYCLIWFSDGGVAIEEITDYIMCGFEFDDTAFRTLFGYRRSIECKQINSTSEEAPKWRITAKNSVGYFIDQNENENN